MQAKKEMDTRVNTKERERDCKRLGDREKEILNKILLFCVKQSILVMWQCHVHRLEKHLPYKQILKR